MTARLLVIHACIQCPDSETTSACWNRNTAGRYSNDLRRIVGPDERGARSLPYVPGYAWPEHAPPPEWCPLPKYEKEST